MENAVASFIVGLEPKVSSINGAFLQLPYKFKQSIFLFAIHSYKTLLPSNSRLLSKTTQSEYSIFESNTTLLSDLQHPPRQLCLHSSLLSESYAGSEDMAFI